MNTVKQLVETIKEGIQEKKGQDIVIADRQKSMEALPSTSSSAREEALLELKLSQVL